MIQIQKLPDLFDNNQCYHVPQHTVQDDEFTRAFDVIVKRQVDVMENAAEKCSENEELKRWIYHNLEKDEERLSKLKG